MERLGREEHTVFNQHKTPFGVDEVGRGCLAGPVCIGVVHIPKNVFDSQWQEFKELGIDDSKRLSSAKRLSIVSNLKKFSIAYAVGFASAQEINSFGIVQSISTAIRRGYTALCHNHSFKRQGRYVYFDGSIKPPKEIDSYEIVIGGDRLIVSIALASVIAKVVRDAYMDKLHTYFPMYVWNKNKGYGSLLHRQALQKYGLTPHHRLLYCRKSISQSYS